MSLPASSSSRQAWIALLLVLIAAFGRVLLASGFPYHYTWDMDQVLATDLCQINSHEFPNHTNHTGFGLYVIFSWLSRLLGAVGLLDVCTEHAFAVALNPFGVLAYTVVFVRALAAPLSLVMPLLVFAAFAPKDDVGSDRQGRWMWACLLAFFVSSHAFVYHAVRMRTEAVSLSLWALSALLGIGAAVRAGGGAIRAPKPSLVAMFGAGALMQLGFITKVQSFFLVMLWPLLVWIVASLRGADFTTITWGRRTRVAAAIPPLLFLLVGALAYGRPSPAQFSDFFTGEGINTFRTEKGITLVFVGIVGMLAAVAFVAWRPLSLRWSSLRGFAGGLLPAWTCGFIAGWGFYLLLFPDTLGLSYWIYEVKVVYFRRTYYVLTPRTALKNLVGAVSVNPWPVLILIFGSVCVSWAFRQVHRQRGRIREIDPLLILGLLLVPMASGAIFLGVRSQLNDQIWLTTIATITGLLTFEIARRSVPGLFTRARWGMVGLLLISILGNMRFLAQMPLRLAANYNQYGFSRERMATMTYDFGGQSRIMTGMFARMGVKNRTEPFLAQIGDHIWQRHFDAQQVFVNAHIPIEAIGVMYPQAPTSMQDGEPRLTKFPESLQGSSFVPLAAVAAQPRTRNLMNPEFVRTMSEAPNKLRSWDGNGLPPIGVMTRLDITALVFLPETEGGRWLSTYPDLSRTDLKVETNDGKYWIGLHIKNYTEIAPSDLKGAGIFVLNTPY